MVTWLSLSVGKKNSGSQGIWRRHHMEVDRDHVVKGAAQDLQISFLDLCGGQKSTAASSSQAYCDKQRSWKFLELNPKSPTPQIALSKPVHNFSAEDQISSYLLSPKANNPSNSAQNENLLSKEPKYSSPRKRPSNCDQELSL